MVVNRRLLRTIPLFAPLTDPELDALRSACRVVTHRRNTVLFSEGDRGDFLFVVLTGQVKVSLHDASGKELILAILGARDVLGEMTLLEGVTARSATATTLAETTGLQCLRKDLRAALENHEFVRSLNQLVNARLRRTNVRLLTMVTKDIQNRVLDQLVVLADSWGRLDGTRVALRPRPTHEVLGHLVGCERETITRALRDLQAAGLVTVLDDSLVLEEAALKRAGFEADEPE